MEIFEYPIREELFQVIESKQQLVNLLQRQANQLKIVKKCFKISTHLDKYIYARCRFCDCNLKYKLKDSKFVLTFSKISHRHDYKRLTNQIETFIKSMPVTMTTHSLMQITTKTFRISKEKFYYHHRKLWFENGQIKDVINQLDRQNYETRLRPYPLEDDYIPDIFITASQKMISQFKQFGQKQFLAFDITYNLVKEIKVQQRQKNKKWGVGLFLGKNNHNRPICFAICIINTQTKNSFIDIFKSFFDMMGGEPSAVITDQQIAISSAIDQLKQQGDYGGFHFLDTFHILRNIVKKTKNQQLIGHLRSAIFSKYHQQYKIFLEKARQICNNGQEISIYNRFVQNSRKYCLSQTPICFHGFSISTSFSQQTNQIIKTFIPRQLCFKVIIKKLLKVVQFLQEKSQQFTVCKTKFEDIFDWRQIKQLRFTLADPVFNFLLKNYIDSLSMNYKEDSHYVYVDQYQIAIINQKFQCPCCFYQKTGIPCSHLVKAIIQNHEDINNYIHDRWKISSQNSTALYVSRKGRPRNSRRNRK